MVIEINSGVYAWPFNHFGQNRVATVQATIEYWAVPVALSLLVAAVVVSSK